MQAFEQQLREAGYLAMGGQVVDATLVPAPKQRGYREREGRHQGRQVGKADLARQAGQGAPGAAGDALGASRMSMHAGR